MKLKLALLVFLWPALTWSQTDSSAYSVMPGKNYFKSYLTDTKQIFTSISDFNTNDWLTTGSVVTSGAILLTLDKSINTYWEQHSSPLADKAVKYGLEPFGRGIYPTAITGGLYLHATIKKNSYDRHVALTTVKALIISQIITQANKQLFHRHRPHEKNPGNWDGPIAPVRFRSFPSGHSTMAFSFAAVMGHAYKDRLWIPVTCYTVAALSSFARVYDNEHWASDALIGSAIGFFVGRSLWRMNETEQKIQLGFTEHGAGVLIPLN